MHLVGARFQPAEKAADAVPLRFPFAGYVRGVTVFQVASVGRGQFGPRHIQRNAFLLTCLGEVALAFPVDIALEGCDGAFGERQFGVGNDFLPVEADDATKTAAVWAGPNWGVEGE